MPSRSSRGEAIPPSSNTSVDGLAGPTRREQALADAFEELDGLVKKHRRKGNDVLDVLRDELDLLRAERRGAVDALRPFVEAFDKVGREFCPSFDGPLDLEAFNAAARIIDGGR